MKSNKHLNVLQKKMLRKPSVHIIPQDLIEFKTDYKKLEKNFN